MAVTARTVGLSVSKLVDYSRRMSYHDETVKGLYAPRRHVKRQDTTALPPPLRPS